MITEKIFKFNYAHIEDVILELADEIRKGYKIVKFNRLPFDHEVYSTSYKPCLEVTLIAKESENI